MRMNAVNLQIEAALMIVLLVESKNLLDFTFLVGKPHAQNSPPRISNYKNNRFIICRLFVLGYFIAKSPRFVAKEGRLFL